MGVNTYFDTICVHPLKSAYTLLKFAYSYAKMRTVKLTDKLEFVELIIDYHILPAQTLERYCPNSDMTIHLAF